MGTKNMEDKYTNHINTNQVAHKDSKEFYDFQLELKG